MLLLTLLPLAGWADVQVTVGEYTVYLDKQYVAIGSPTIAPTVVNKANVTDGVVKAGAECDFSEMGVVTLSADKKTETAVGTITVPGLYYKVVRVALNNEATKYDKLLVPFYAGEPIGFDFIYDKSTYDESVRSGGLKLYYENCIAKAEAAVDGKYQNGTKSDWENERDNWSVSASTSHDKYARDHSGFPWIVITKPQTGSFQPQFDYTGPVGLGNNHQGIYKPWGNGVFGSRTGEFSVGVASTNEEYGTGQIGVDPTSNETVGESIFDINKLTAIWVPEDLNLADPNLAVEPQTFQKVKIMAVTFHVPFGTDVTGSTVTPNMFTILTGQCDETALAASGVLTFKYLDGDNTNVSVLGHPFKIEYNGEPWVYSGGSSEVTYEIVVTTDQNTMYFDATPNSFLADQAPVVEGDLTYTGEAQNLIASAGKTAFEHQGDNASKSNVKYLVVTEDKVIPDNGDVPQAGTDTPEKWKLNYEPATSEWKDDATETNVGYYYTGEGVTREQHPSAYYVFAKASAGIGAEEGWTEGKIEYRGKVKMLKATPVLEMAGIDASYFKKTTGTTTNGLHKALTPSLTVKVANGTDATTGETTYNPLTAGTEYKADDITYMVYKSDFTGMWNMNAYVCPELGNYWICPSIKANDNLKAVDQAVAANGFKFEVVAPKVTVTATATDVPYNNAPKFGYTVSNWEGDFTEFVVGDPVYTLYDANGDEVHKEGINGSEGYPSGTWTVKVSGLRVVSTVADPTATPPVSEVEGDHEITYVSGSITIGKADIVAKVADQNLIYGQALPVKLQHVEGLTGQSAATTFEAETDWTFNATLVDATTHEPILDDKGKEQVKVIESGNLLDAGTYRVTCSGQTFSMPGALNQFNVIAGAGYWTVAPKNLDNSDSRFNQNVNNIQNFWNPQNRPSVTYTGEPVLPNLSVITYNGKVLEADVPATYYAEGEDIPEGKKVGDEKTAEVEKDYSIEVISAGGNIHAANNVQIRLTGHGNYTGTRTLAYNINKKAIRVLPVEAGWVCGSDEVVEGESIYDIDWVDLFSKLVPADKKNNAFLVETATKTEGEGADAKEVTYIKTNNLKKQNGFSSLAVRRLTGPNVGTFNNGIQAYLPENATPKAQDYDFTPGTGKVVITPGTIALKVKQDMTAVYAGKEAYPLTTGDFVLDEENSTLGEFYVQDDNWRQLVQTLDALTWDKPAMPADKRFDVGDTYTISIATTEADKLSSTNYEISITPDEKGGTVASANVTITKAPIELTVADLGAETNPILFDNLGTAFATYAGTTDGVDHVTISTVEGKKLRGGDVKEDLISAVTYDDDDLTVGENEDALYVVGTSLYSNNYTPTENKGSIWLTYATNLELTSVMADNVTYDKDGKETARVANDWSKLLAHDGKPVKKITLQLKPATMEGKPAFSQWNEDEWHAMVLPFAVTVKELSQAFDFAYINIVDPTKTTENNVQFKVPNILDEIPANVPFCIKSSVPYKYAVEDDPDTEANETEVGDVLTFERTGNKFFEVNLTGVDEDWMVEGVDAGMGYKFAGTYAENFAIDKTKSELRFINNKWYFIKSNSDKVYNMPPYTGFANLGVASSTREVTFTFEEEDGSTTAIKAVDFFNGNKANAEGVYRVDGVKMNTAPTQRGVYIQDGKKFVK